MVVEMIEEVVMTVEVAEAMTEIVVAMEIEIEVNCFDHIQ